jgi:hypothetical protein
MGAVDGPVLGPFRSRTTPTEYTMKWLFALRLQDIPWQTYIKGLLVRLSDKTLIEIRQPDGVGGQPPTL